MNNILIITIEIATLIFTIDYTSDWIQYIWLIPIPVILFCQLFIKENKVEDEVKKTRLFDIFVSEGANTIFVFLYFLLYVLIRKFVPVISGKNCMTLMMFLLLNKDVFKQSLGGRMQSVRIINDTLLDKLKILFKNFILISPMYLVTIMPENTIVHGSKSEIIAAILIIINIVNIWSRFYIFKFNSFLERLVHIKYMKVRKVKDEKLVNE